jgi:hypothetical protein
VTCLAVLDRYLDESISTSDKRKRVVEERDLLAVMEDITKEVIGRPADDGLGRTKIQPSLVKSYDLVNSEIGSWRTKFPDKAQLYKEKQARMEQLRSQIMGATSIVKLKKLPEQRGKGGTIGKIVEWFVMMQTWLAEESAATTGVDIVTDRLTLTCRHSPAGPGSSSRDIHRYIGLASLLGSTTSDAKREFNREMTKQDCARARPPSTKEPPPKRTATAAKGRRLFRVVKSWSGAKQPPRAGVTFLPVTEGELLVPIGEVDPESDWLEVQREDGSESGTVPVKQSNGEMRLLEVEPPEPPEEPVPIASDESEESGEEGEDEAEAMRGAEHDAFVERVQEGEARARAEADAAAAAECGYD